MIRFYNGRLLSMNGNTEISSDEVWTDGDKIVYVGAPKAEMPEFDREIDLNGNVLMPGFKDAHTHSAMTFLRSFADDLPLQEWLFNKVFPYEAGLEPEHIYALNRLAVLEYLTSGITASFDMYYHLDAFTQSNIDMGFRSVICGSFAASNNFDDIVPEHEHFSSLHPLISHRLGFHAEYTANKDLLKCISEYSHFVKEPVWSHNSETASEVQQCIERHGMTPTELFDSLGLLDYGGGGFHCVYLSEHDMEIFKNRGLWAVTNPGSNSKLASGIAPVTELMSRGIGVAIGTDGPASNNALDMFREMYLTCVLQKLRNQDAAACDASKVLKMAASDGAAAIGLRDCDCIAVGKQADMIVIDLHRPNMQPLHDIPKNIVYSGSKENVRLTMIAGKILYENGEFFVGDDPEYIYSQVDKATRELIDKLA